MFALSRSARAWGFGLLCALCLMFVMSSACRPTTGPGADGSQNNNNNNSEGSNNNNNNNDGGTNPEAGSERKPPAKAGIPAIQDPAANGPKKDDPVRLTGVIVTSPVFDAAATLKGFFVSDPSFPAKFGGIMVVVEKDFSQALQIGDVVDIDGVVDEYFNNTQINASVLKGGLVSKTGANKKDDVKPVVIKSEDVPGAPADKANPDSSKSEAYEGMLVELKDVEVEKIGDRGEIYLKGGAVVDRGFFRWQGAKVGDKKAYVRGIVQYSFDIYRIQPRFADDLAGATPECQSDAQCRSGFRCNTGTGACTVISCNADADCRTGETCDTEKNRCSKPLQDYTVVEIQDANQKNHPAASDPVNVKGAIVISPVFNAAATLKGFFVADPSFPAKYGGVMVVVEKEFAETLEIGDEVDIQGKSDEYFNNTQINARSVEGGKITKTGNNKKDMVKAIVVTPAQLPGEPTDKANPDSSDAEAYEGMLVELKDVEVEKLGTRGEVYLKGGAVADDTLFNGWKPKVGDKIPTLRGVVQYSFDLYRILPRFTADISSLKICTSSADCDPTETCDVSIGACQGKGPSVTIPAVQNAADAGHPAKGASVSLKGVIVISQVFDASKTLKGFFVADPAFPAKFGGVMVVVDMAFAETLAIGDELDIEGKTDEYFNNTQINARSSTGGSVTKTGNNKKEMVKPVTVTSQDIPSTPKDKANPDTSDTEAYEGMLIELKGVTVTEAPNQYGEWKVTGDILVDDTLFKHTPKVGDKVDLVGIIQYSFDLYRVLPRSADDIKTAAP